MRDAILALLCGWALADVPGRDQSCEPLEVWCKKHCFVNVIADGDSSF